ncbi:unnamed protein product [Prorocentrum cordatum]|uniref:Subtilisin n=1 Tax=Prorocentrum cordatum TaxID=2364126 RepID=A0ABN9TWT2_9DINO|nr:unnamed protein product [Polarella glacialis]
MFNTTRPDCRSSQMSGSYLLPPFEHPCCDDPCDLLGQYDAGNNEMNTAADLVAAAKGMLGMDAHVIIDTGRNGVVDMRKDCKNWCNPRGGGAGVPSTASTANTSLVELTLVVPLQSSCAAMRGDGASLVTASHRHDYGAHRVKCREPAEAVKQALQSKRNGSTR